MMNRIYLLHESYKINNPLDTCTVEDRWVPGRKSEYYKHSKYIRENGVCHLKSEIVEFCYQR